MITCCVITKNEERHLDRCLSSVSGIATEIIVVDSGSTDNTLVIAQKHSATVIEIEWQDDYAYARNVAIENAQQPWILFLDGDESLQHGASLRKNLSKTRSSVGGVVMSRYDHFINPETGKQTTVPVGTVRLFRNERSIRFKYHIHEVVGPSVRDSGFKFTFFKKPVIFHHIDQHSKEFLRKKQTYYLGLLDKGLVDNPQEAWLIYQKAKTLWFFEQNQEALELFQWLAQLEEERELRIAAHNNAGVLLGQQGEYKSAVEMLEKSLILERRQSQTHYLLGDTHERFGYPAKAIGHYIKVKTRLHLVDGKSFVPGGLFLFPYQKYYRLALCYKSTHMTPIAKYYLEKSLQDNPNYVDALFLKAKWALKSGKKGTAEKLLHKVRNLNPEWVEPQHLTF